MYHKNGLAKILDQAMLYSMVQNKMIRKYKTIQESYNSYFNLKLYNTEENVKLRCQFWFVDCHIENWINKYREKNWQGHKKTRTYK